MATSHSKTSRPPALKGKQRGRLESELESGPAVDQRRDDIMRRMLASPPKPHSEMKLGKRKISNSGLRDVAEGLGPAAADMEAAHIRAKKKAPPKRG